jgi:hypothetical protein
MPHVVKELPPLFTERAATVNTVDDLHAIAREWYAAKIVAGGEPRVVVGGALDGMCNFEVVLDRVRYWMTGVGLFDPRSDR